MSDSDQSVSIEDVFAEEAKWIKERRTERSETGLAPSANAELSEDINEALDGDLVGLAISGGGIRSATFALGVLQQLAALKLIPRFDYLSTVSGGGYVGSWLSAWIHRAGLGHVQEEMQPPRYRANDPDQDVERNSIRHLRLYSNYLAPVPSLFSLDGWLLFAIYLRNLFLNQLVFLFGLMAVLLLARGVAEGYSIVFRSNSDLVMWAFAAIGAGASLLSILGTAQLLRAKNDDESQSKLFWRLVVPWFVTAWAFTMVFVSQRWANVELTLGDTLWVFVPIVATLATVMGFFGVRDREKAMAGAGAGLIGGAIGGVLISAGIFLFSRLGSSIDKAPIETIYVAIASVFGVPSLLILLVIISFLHVGLSRRGQSEVEREWWSGVNSRLLMIALGWFALFGVVVGGPWIVGRLVHGGWTEWIAGSGWLGAVVMGVLSGGSKSTGTGKSKLSELIAKAAPILFLLTVAIGIATLIIWVCYDVYTHVGSGEESHTFLQRLDGYWLLSDLDTADKSGWPILAVMLASVVSLGLAIWLGNRIGVNTFSLQHLYQNRLVRCYLGASNANRDPQPIVNIDPNDDLLLHKLKESPENGSENACGPYHLLNTALNRRAGDRGLDSGERSKSLALLERQAESFVFAPLFSGSESTGYTDTTRYGDELYLGTAMALSGAAVAPNMGYHTSATIRILLTLFNLRLGGWYGNPKKENEVVDKTNPSAGYELLVAELLGQTGNESDYVYLSDGGHFDNSGVYELVRRKCRFIVAIDSGTDAHAHDNIGRVIRQVRIDFGVEIELDTNPITPGDDGLSDQHFVIGRIKYENLGPAKSPMRSSGDDYAYDDHQGIIVWIKSGVTGHEAGDVRTHRAADKTFPYNSTVDQFFSETQFESYRELGAQSVRSLFERFQIDQHPGDSLSGVSTREIFTKLYERRTCTTDAQKPSASESADSS